MKAQLHDRIDYEIKRILEDQSILINRPNDGLTPRIMQSFYTRLLDTNPTRTFYLKFSAELDSEQKLADKLFKITNLFEHELYERSEQSGMFENNPVCGFFDLLSECYGYTFFLIEDLDKLLFYCGEIDKKPEFDEYKKAFESKEIRQKVLYLFHDSTHAGGMPNKIIRSTQMLRNIGLIGSSTTGTIENYYVFRNPRSAIWGNLANAGIGWERFFKS